MTPSPYIFLPLCIPTTQPSHQNPPEARTVPNFCPSRATMLPGGRCINLFLGKSSGERHPAVLTAPTTITLHGSRVFQEETGAFLPFSAPNCVMTSLKTLILVLSGTARSSGSRSGLQCPYSGHSLHQTSPQLQT